MRNVEVNEQSNFMITEFEVGQNLSEMEGKQFLHCFQFDDDAVFDQEVDSIARVNLNPVVDDWESCLMLESDTVLRKLITQTRIVRAFKASRADCRVHFHRCSENPCCDHFVKHEDLDLRVLLSSVVESFLQSPVL